MFGINLRTFRNKKSKTADSVKMRNDVGYNWKSKDKYPHYRDPLLKNPDAGRLLIDYRRIDRRMDTRNTQCGG